jgi:hypothetical protein
MRQFSWLDAIWTIAVLPSFKTASSLFGCESINDKGFWLLLLIFALLSPDPGRWPWRKG